MKKINKKAFTIVELVIVIAVMAVLAAVLIPTFSGIIKNSKLRADESELSAINTQLAIFKTENGREIESESDIYGVIAETYGQDKADAFYPRNVKDGYHFWFDTASNTIVLKQYKELGNAVGVAQSSEPTESAFVKENKDSFKTFKNRYYFLDNGGSDVANAIKHLAKVDIAKFNESLSNVRKDDEELKNAFLSKLGTVAIVADGITYVHSADLVEKFYFLGKVETISSTIVGDNQKGYIAKAENVKDREITLPSTVTMIEEKALWFDQAGVKINTPFTAENVADALEAYATNGTIVYGGTEAILDGNKLGGVTLDYANPVESFDISIDNKYVANTTGVVANVSVGNFVGKNAGEVSSKDVIWSSSNETLVSVDENGVVTLKGEIATDAETVTITAKAVATNGGAVVERVDTLTIVKINRVTNFAIKQPSASDNNSYVVSWANGSETIYVAYNFGDSISLVADNFEYAYPCEIGKSPSVTFTSTNAHVEVDGNEISLDGIPDATECEITITATADGTNVSKNLKVLVVRINSATMETDFGVIELDTDPDKSQKTITYDGSCETYALGGIASKSLSVINTGVVINEAVSFEAGAGNVFTLNGNKLVLTKTDFGTQDLIVRVGGCIEDIVEITVIDNTAAPFEVNDITNNVKMGEYLFRVGNGNSFVLSKLFNSTKPADDITLKIYDASKTDGSGNKTLIATSGSFSATYTTNLTKDTWANSTIKFNGTGVAIIEITTSEGTATLAVEVVNAKNVTQASEIVSGSTNYVLLNDIAWGTANKTSISGTIYGNGFAINATKFTSSVTGSNNALFYLSGTIDNLVINGPVYPELIYQSETSESKPYYVAGIYTTGNVTISNSYISGFRMPVWVSGADKGAYIENTTLVGGNYCNLYLEKGDLYLKDVTTVQTKTEDTFGKGKTILGAGIIVESGISNTCVVKIEGEFNQYNWLSTDDSSCFDSDVWSIIKKLFDYGELCHSVNGKSYVNSGILFAGSRASADGIDNRSAEIQTVAPYGLVGVSGSLMSVQVNATVYSRISSKTITAVPAYAGYNPTAQGTLKPTFKHNLSGDRIEKSIDIPNGETFELDVSVYTVSKYSGQDIVVNVSCNGGTRSGDKITFSTAGTYTLTYTIVDNTFYGSDGARQTNSIKYVYTVTVVISNSNHPNAVIDVANVNGTAYYLESGVGDIDYSAHISILEGLVITDYDEAGNTVPVTISETTMPKGLTVTVTGFKGSAKTKEFERKNDKKRLYLYDDSVRNNNDYTTMIVTYKYTGLNGKEIIVTKTYNKCTEKLESASSSSGGGGCVTPDTLVTLADGSKKEIQDVTYEDMLLVWDFYKGEYTAVPSAIIFNHGYDNNTVITLNFSDGTQVKAINLHQFFDADLNKFVTIDAESVADYVGHEFAKRNGDGYVTVKLVSYEISEEYIEAYGIISAVHYNILVEDMFSTDFMYEDYDLFNYFEVGEGMVFDEELMQADIEKYGAYTYEDFAEYLTYDEFVGFNVQYFKVAVGKGDYTYEGILALIEEYLKN